MKPTLQDYARGALAIFTWAGFGLAALWATKPVWSYLIFGFNPTLDDLLSIRCL
jgi:hypothetical protein